MEDHNRGVVFKLQAGSQLASVETGLITTNVEGVRALVLLCVLLVLAIGRQQSRTRAGHAIVTIVTRAANKVLFPFKAEIRVFSAGLSLGGMDVDSYGLARAVGVQETQELSCFDMEADVVHGGEIALAVGQLLGHDRLFRHRWLAFGSGCGGIVGIAP